MTEEEWNTFNNQMQKWGIPKSIYLRCLINGIVITGGMTEEAEKVIGKTLDEEELMSLLKQ